MQVDFSISHRRFDELRGSGNKPGQFCVITAGTCARQRTNYSARSLSFGCGMAGAPRGTRTACTVHTRPRAHGVSPVPTGAKGKSDGERLTIDDDVSHLLSARYTRVPVQAALYTLLHRKTVVNPAASRFV